LMSKVANKQLSGHTLIELVLVMVLIALLAGMGLLGMLRSIDLYTGTTRDYLEVFQEGKIALEKMAREIREATPGNVSASTDSLSVIKKTGHTTEADSNLEITFFRSGNTLQRTSSAGTYDLADNITVFNPGKDEDTGVITVDLTLAKGGNTVRLRTATLPRQKPTPAP
jgi:type II secretory pathway pseudopilin PulG